MQLNELLERLSNKLGLHSLSTRCCQSKSICFYKIENGLLPEYLHSFKKENSLFSIKVHLVQNSLRVVFKIEIESSQ